MGAVVLTVTSAQLAYGCSPSLEFELYFQDRLDIEFLFEATVLEPNEELVLAEGAYRDKVTVHSIRINRMSVGPTSYEWQRVRIFDGYGPNPRLRSGEKVVIGLMDVDRFSQGALAEQISEASDFPVFFIAPCGSDPWFLDGDANFPMGRMLLEMFDGDGAPLEEAIVFDRFRRGQSGAPLPVAPEPLPSSPRPRSRP